MLCLLMRFLFLSTYRLFHLVFPYNIYGKNVARTFLGCPYFSNDTKTHLDAALLKIA